MSSFTGIIAGNIVVDNLMEFCSVSLVDNTPTVPDPFDIGLVSEIGSGSFTSNFPLSMLETEQSGQLISTFLNDYYYRIYVIPATFDLGPIISQVQEEFVVWNAYFEDKTCTVINPVNGDEIELAGLTAPFILKALGYTTYTITVPADEGSPQFETILTFDFGADDQPFVTITGTRIVLFPFKPLTPMDESLEWLTDILQAKDGSEQRISLRQTPRQGFGLSCRFESHQDQARLDALLFATQKRAWGLPIWSEAVIHTTTITDGATTVTVDTTNADFRDDSLAVIWKSETENEVIRIDTVSAGTLNLQTPVAGTFTGNKFILPCRIAQMNTSINRKDAPGSGSTADFGFIVRDNVLLTGYTAATIYKSLPVLTQATYVNSGEQEKSSDADIIISDYETGPFDIYSDNLFNKNTQSHLFKGFTKAVCWNNRKFIHSLLGQQGVVWIPSFKDDMILTDTIAPTDNAFSIQNIGLAEHMGLNVLRTHLAFIFTNGTMLFREIMGITESGDDEIISINTTLGVEVPVGGCKICFLDKYRLNSDRVDIKWQYMGWNQCGVQFMRIKA
jgi:hypothetical protein